MNPAAISAAILLAALAMFVSERVRHDLVAVLALLACVLTGLVSPEEAFVGFADPAVVAVASVLVVGRAVELSGLAATVARVSIPATAPFQLRLAMLLIVAAVLSAFMNNIAALVITMPIAAEIARASRRPPAATLMPLAFATILGGMTTLIGTPANLILSSVREDRLGRPFGFFSMTTVGAAVMIVGLAYLGQLGWRLLPIRRAAQRERRAPWRVFELAVPAARATADLIPRLRATGARLLAVMRDGHVVAPRPDALQPDDQLLLLARPNQWTVAERTGLTSAFGALHVPGVVTAQTVVAHGSFLIGLSYDAVRIRSEGTVSVVAAGASAGRARQPLSAARIAVGDQLFVRGPAEAVASFARRARLLEIDRLDTIPLASRRAPLTLAIFTAAIAAIVFGGVSPAIGFFAAAAAVAILRLLPAEEVYASIDWTVIILLAAMLPVGRSFETSGAAAQAAAWLGQGLAGQSLPIVLAALCGLTLLLSVFLNNVATAIIMGPLAIDLARLLGVHPDAALLAVLIGASSDFLTPIGHQNNLLVMGPGGYQFTDYARMGAPLVVLVVGTAAMVLSWLYG